MTRYIIWSLKWLEGKWFHGLDDLPYIGKISHESIIWIKSRGVTRVWEDAGVEFCRRVETIWEIELRLTQSRGRELGCLGLSWYKGSNKPRDPERLSVHPERLNLHSGKGLLSNDNPDKNKEMKFKSLTCLGNIFESSFPRMLIFLWSNNSR